MSDFSTRIKDLREQSGLLQSELGKKLNVSRACISSWECGRTEPSVEQVNKMAKIFNVSLNYLATGEYDVAVEDTSIKAIIEVMPHLDSAALQQINSLSAYLLNINNSERK